MTPVSAKRRVPRALDGHSAGFTLIELLVVIGIIVLLAGLLIPTVIKSWTSAKRTKLAADFATIGQGLEEWKKDHNGQYPQVTQPNTGFAVLGRELVGVYGDGLTGGPPPTNDPNDPPAPGTGPYKPGDCVQMGAGTFLVSLTENNGTPLASPNWVPFDCRDGLDGPGIRLSNGRKAGPYLKPESFRVRGCALLDPNDKPILYFPARAGTVNLTTMIGGVSPFVDQSKRSLFDADDNLLFFERFDDTVPGNAVRRIRAMLGDLNNNGIIDPGEQAASTGPYLLWAPGPDGLYGPVTHPSTKAPTASDVTKCDDVTNFGR